MCKSKPDIHPKIAEALQEKIRALKERLDNASDHTGVVDPDAERVEISRTEWEDALDWIAFIISRAAMTPEEREAQEIDAEQHRVFHGGLGI